MRDSRTGQTGEIPCSFVVNAAGSWVGGLAHTAGLDINVKPDRGTLVAFNHRFTSRVINRLRKASDGDIFVPHGSITILGTTSKKTDKPDDTVPDTAEVHELLDIGRVLFPEIDSYRILRTFAGTRPLYTADPSAEGRGASRNFVVLDHEKEGLKGMATICGGKLTTYRLMGERMADLVCAKLGVAAQCRTAVEPLVEDTPPALLERARKVFPAQGLEQAESRLGDSFAATDGRLRPRRGKRRFCANASASPSRNSNRSLPNHVPFPQRHPPPYPYGHGHLSGEFLRLARRGRGARSQAVARRGCRPAVRESATPSPAARRICSRASSRNAGTASARCCGAANCVKPSWRAACTARPST